MKRLYRFETGLDYFFKQNTTNKDVCDWINKMIIHGDNTFVFRLGINEAYSCSAVIYEDEKEIIVITGDEDYHELQLIELIPAL